MRIELRVEHEAFGPTRRSAERFVIELNEFGEAEIRHAGDPRAHAGTSASMHVSGASITLTAEAKP